MAMKKNIYIVKHENEIAGTQSSLLLTQKPGKDLTERRYIREWSSPNKYKQLMEKQKNKKDE